MFESNEFESIEKYNKFLLEIINNQLRKDREEMLQRTNKTHKKDYKENKLLDSPKTCCEGDSVK